MGTVLKDKIHAMAVIFNPAGKSEIVYPKEFDDQQMVHRTSVSAVESQGVHCEMESDRIHILVAPITETQIEV